MPGLAATPPMGWNSWDCFGTTVTEAEVLANADVLAQRLLPVGYDTVVVDIDWYDPTARAHGFNADAPLVLDAYGRPQPDPVRFPSAVSGGFGPLAAAVHARGLRFGLHLMRGLPRLAVEGDLPVLGTGWTARDAADPTSTCGWQPDNYGLDHDHPAAAAWLDSLVAQLVAWEVDYVKVDDMLTPSYAARDIEAWAGALDRGGRDIVLSLSPGTGLSTVHLEHLRRHAQLWRISNDVWDLWPDVQAQFARLARWAPLQRAGGWADADMLPVGRIGLRAERGEPRDSGLTPDEQRTLLTLWAMARSPLMIGGDLPSSSADTLDRLANPALGRTLRESRDGCERLREPDGDGELIVWTAGLGDEQLVALFWTGPGPYPATVPLRSLLGHERAAAGWVARDLWEPGAPAPVGDEVRAELPAHGVVWLALAPAG